ncbi:MAG: 16S rRNA (cytosine(967)-C(5))-methyltransferase RsmB [Actinomycetota bacterium]
MSSARRAADARRSASGAAHPNPRTVALEVIRAVSERGAYSTIATNAALRRSELPRRDRDLATELAYGTIRRLIPLDSALRPHVPSGLEGTRPLTLACLRLGAYQLLFTRIPAHAAVSETVALARGKERGFVNAVLRRLSAGDVEWPNDGGDESVSIRTGLSAWAVGELRRLTDDVERAAGAFATPAQLAIRVNVCRTSVDDVRARLRDAGIGSEPHPIVPGTLLLEKARPVGELPGFDRGWFTVQDAASVFVANALEARLGDRVLDACAAPGGKTTALACAMGTEGSVVAADIRERRLRLASAAAERLGVGASFVVQDATRPALRGPFDRVLVDAPCSGIGAARRRPELLWRPRREDLSRLARLQVAIVRGAAELLGPGGRLVFSVCTFPRAETDAAADAILRHCPFLEPADIQGPDGPAPRVRLWPHEHGTDGMFVAAFRSTASGRG